MREQVEPLEHQADVPPLPRDLALGQLVQLPDRALLDVPGLGDPAVGAVVDQRLEGTPESGGQLGAVLVDAGAVGAAVDRLQVHDLEELAVTRGLGDVDGGERVVEGGGDAAGAQPVLVLRVAVGDGRHDGRSPAHGHLLAIG